VIALLLLPSLRYKALPTFNPTKALVGLFWLATLFIAPLIQADESDWFLEDTQNYRLDMRYGQFEDGASLSSIALNTPFLLNSEFSGRYTRVSGGEEDEFASSFYIQSDPLAKFTLGVGLETGEREDSYRLQDWLLLAGTNLQNWTIELSVIRGEIETVPTLLLGSEFINPPSEREQLSSTRTGIGTSVIYYAQQWAWQFSYRDYQHDKPNQPNQDDIIAALNDVGVENREQLEQFLNQPEQRQQLRQYSRALGYTDQQYYRQVSHVADQEASTRFSFFAGNYRLSAGLSWYDSLYFKEQVSSLYGAIERPINNTVDLGFLLSNSDEDASLYAEIGLGLNW